MQKGDDDEGGLDGVGKGLGTAVELQLRLLAEVLDARSSVLCLAFKLAC